MNYSDFYELGTPISLTFANTSPVEVFFLDEKGNRQGSEQPGLEENKAERVMQIVAAKGALKLDDATRAGDTATYRSLGRKVQVTLKPFMPPQIPDVADDLGWQYQVSLSWVG